MITTLCYTSFSFSYLAKARVLAKTFKRYNPQIMFLALILDECPNDFKLDINDEPFDDVQFAGTFLQKDDFHSWIFKHNIVEACTAIKGPAIQPIINKYKPEKIIYLDPDIAVFDSMSPIVDALDEYDIILTPHQLTHEKKDDHIAIRDNEIASLKYGIFNFGFYAFKTSEEGLKFSTWWSDRLMDYCEDNIPDGLFTDQKWGNHIPVFFDKVLILKDPGYNVASWNLSQREISFNDIGQILVNGNNLVFYHFTKLGPLGEQMTARYASTNIEVYELWEWYKNEVDNNRSESIPGGWWVYGHYDDNTPIKQTDRDLYKKRIDLQKAFTNPFDKNGLKAWISQATDI